MAAKVLEDVLNNFISIEALLEWLSNQNTVSDVNVFINHYKCSQFEFVTYFLNFLREQSTVILQSSCSAETPCKSSQKLKVKSFNYASDKSLSEVHSETSFTSTQKKTNFRSLEPFPALAEASTRSKSNDKSNKVYDSTLKDSPSLSRDTCKRFRKLEFLPGKKENSTSGQEDTCFANVTDSRSSLYFSTPKSSGRESDIADYFSDVVNLEGSPDWSPGFKKDHNKIDQTDKIKTFNGVSSNIKSKSHFNDSAQSRISKSSSRAMLGDFILNDLSSSEGKKDKKSKVRKRINTTRVNSEPCQYEGSPSFNISSSTIESYSSLTDEREALKMESPSFLEQLEKKSLFNKDSVSTSAQSVSTKKVIPSVDLATYVEELRRLSRIYSLILDENYCQNIMIELCFVMSLLVIQDHTSISLDDNLQADKERNKFLGSVHNCVYFAVETLWLQRNILVLLNLATLKLLSENKEVQKFNSELTEFLAGAYIERQSRGALKRQICENKGTALGNVSFECETDNRDNFTSELNFHSFRKQRDLFYNILAIWEKNHLSSGWDFSIKLDSKIRMLLSISSDPTNLLHLARLFRNQLVMSCCGDYRAEDESDEEVLQLLASVDPNKILRLRARFRSTPKRQGPCPQPDFMGYQEFFKDFIVSTSYTVFHYYLKNSLCDEILKLNDTEFSSDQEDDDSCLDLQTQNRYFQQINILCLLGKFLGFLEFLPYNSDTYMSDRVLSIHCAVRQNLLPLFDIETCLKTAFTSHKLTVTVPWIVSYLSMIDFSSARLKTYQNIWRLLINIYRQLRMCKNIMNAFYLKLILGWIFQLPNFPSDLFFNVLEDVSKCSSLELSIEFSVGLDSYNFIEENILYSVCPYLSEINSILTEKSGCNVKHIRPVTQGSSSNLSQITKQIQIRLEESFLHGQSSSTRRTIEFVTERVSSVAVKYLISDIVPKVKEKALEELKELNGDSDDVDDKLCAVSEKCYADLMSVCEIESWQLCSVRSEKALSALLSLDLDGAVRETCTQIVIRQSAEKVKRWIQTHITLGIIQKEFSTIKLKKAKKTDISDLSLENFASESRRVSSQVSRVRETLVDECSISHVFILLREIIWDIYEGRIIPWDEMNKSFADALKIIVNSSDVSPAIEKTLLSLTLDILIIICVRYGTELIRDNFSYIIQFLKQLNEVCCPGNALERIICPRNIALLFRESKNKEKSWENVGTVILCLMEENLLSEDQVENQLVSLLRQSWEKDQCELYSKFFKHILNRYSSKSGCDKFTLLVEYLIETMHDNDEAELL